MAKLIIENVNQEFELPDGSDIKETCEHAGVPMPCGTGVCGMCVVKVLEGMDNLSAPAETEKDFFGDIQDERLACQCKILSGTVKISF